MFACLLRLCSVAPQSQRLRITCWAAWERGALWTTSSPLTDPTRAWVWERLGSPPIMHMDMLSRLFMVIFYELVFCGLLFFSFSSFPSSITCPCHGCEGSDGTIRTWHVSCLGKHYIHAYTPYQTDAKSLLETLGKTKWYSSCSFQCDYIICLCYVKNLGSGCFGAGFVLYICRSCKYIQFR